MTATRLPEGFNSAAENDLLQKGADNLWYTRGPGEFVAPHTTVTVSNSPSTSPSPVLATRKGSRVTVLVNVGSGSWTAADDVLVLTSVTLALPGDEITVKDLFGFAGDGLRHIPIAAAPGELIDGVPVYVLRGRFASVTFRMVSGSWKVVSTTDLNPIALANNLLNLRVLVPRGTPTLDDLSENLVALHGANFQGITVLKAHTSGNYDVSDSGLVTLKGAGSSLNATFSRVVDAAMSDAADVLAVGESAGGGTSACAFSSDHGFTWTTRAAPNGIPVAIVYNARYSRYISTRTTGVFVNRTLDAGVTWSSANHQLDSATGGIAVLGSVDSGIDGRTVVAGVKSGNAAWALSSDGGVVWSYMGSSPDEPNLISGNPGWVAGNGGSTIWFMGLKVSSFVIYASTDAVNWTLRATVSRQTGFAAVARLLCCQTTGILVAVVAGNSNGFTEVSASLDGGYTWVGPRLIRYGIATPAPAESFSLAGGRLFSTYNDALMGSDGIGLSSFV